MAPVFKTLAVLSGPRRKPKTSALRAAAKSCSTQLRTGGVTDFSKCVRQQMQSTPHKEKQMARHKKKRGSQRRRYRKYKHAGKRLRRHGKLKIGRASKHCTIKNGYTTKTARRDCMSKVMRGQFAGRRKRHHRRRR